MDLIKLFIEKYGKSTVIISCVICLIIAYLGFLTSQPGEKYSVLWGLFSGVKKIEKDLSKKGYPEKCPNCCTRKYNPEKINRDFKVLNRKTIIDLSNRIKTPLGFPTNVRFSPVYRDVELEIVKTRRGEQYVEINHNSVGDIMDIACSTHEYCIIKEDIDSDVGKSWKLMINISKHTPDLPFTIKYRAIYWNTFQSKKAYTGIRIIGNPEYEDVEINLPKNMQFELSPWFEKSADTKNKNWETCKVSILKYNNLDYISLRVKKPKPNHLYKILWTWRENKL